MSNPNVRDPFETLPPEENVGGTMGHPKGKPVNNLVDKVVNQYKNMHLTEAEDPSIEDMKAEMREIPAFELKPGMRERLEKKLTQYKGRGDSLDSYYKVFVLSKLLDEGVVNPTELAETGMEEVTEDDAAKLLNAIRVVRDRNNDDESNIRGGTGLPE